MKERNKQDPVPDDYMSLLSYHQKMSFGRLQQFGWQIAFIRRPLFQDVTIVLYHDSEGHRLFEKNGLFNKPFYGLRQQDLK